MGNPFRSFALASDSKGHIVNPMFPNQKRMRMKTKSSALVSALLGVWLLLLGNARGIVAEGLVLWLDGVNDYASIPDNNSLDLGTTGSSTGDILTSWPSWAEGYALEGTTNLSPPISWLAVTNTPVTAGNKKTVTLNNAGTNTFFRLRNP
jgi:hypothetical protein